MTKEEAYYFLVNISYKFGNMDIEYLTEKDGDKMREAVDICIQEAFEEGKHDGYLHAKADRWIPVSERLPKDAYGCIVTVMDVDLKTQNEFENVLPYFVGYDGETWNNADGEPILYEVIAWMKAPEPYKAEGSGEEMTDITAKPFDWNDNLSEEAIEDFKGIQKDLPYCTCQSIGMALAKLELLEKQMQEPKSEWEHAHEILKAYSDGASAVLDKIRAEIDAARFVDKDTKHCRNANATGLEVALDIIDKYKAEGSDKE